MIHDKFLWNCKELYLKDIHPFDFATLDSEHYQGVVLLGQELIAKQGLQLFLGLLMEYQYRINFWAAILGLEYGNPMKDEILINSDNDTIINHCIDVVIRHISHKASEEQINNGEIWIEKTKRRYSIE